MELGIPARNVPARPFLRPVAHRHSAKAANIIGGAIAYALASQTPPDAPPPPPGCQEDES